jgi:Flp pilus assembly pilin Flp
MGIDRAITRTTVREIRPSRRASRPGIPEGELSAVTLSLLFEHVGRLRHRQEGQTMAEYAVILAVIVVATVAVFTALSGGISGAINNVTGIF